MLFGCLTCQRCGRHYRCGNSTCQGRTDDYLSASSKWILRRDINAVLITSAITGKQEPKPFSSCFKRIGSACPGLQAAAAGGRCVIRGANIYSSVCSFFQALQGLFQVLERPMIARSAEGVRICVCLDGSGICSLELPGCGICLWLDLL